MPVPVSSAEDLLHAKLAEVMATLVDHSVNQQICTGSSDRREESETRPCDRGQGDH
jgi:hypothetical protein